MAELPISEHKTMLSRDEKDQIQIESVLLSKIADVVGTPFYAYSENELIGRFQRFRKSFKEPIEICFAVKANSNLAILNSLKNQSSGFDIVSGGELFRLSKIGVDGKKIVFSGVGKKEKEIIEGLHYGENGILSFNVESFEELVAINHIAKNENKIAPICLRLNPDVDAKTHPYISTGLTKNKFGLFKDEIVAIIDEHQAQLKSIKIIGLSVHIGSQITQLDAFENAFKKTDELLFSLKDRLPHLKMIDLGGGIGIQYESEKEISYQNYAKVAEKFFGSQSHWQGSLKLYFEPGRTIIGPAGILGSRVLYQKKSSNRHFTIIDSGMNDLMRPSLYQGHHKVLFDGKLSGQTFKTTVVGPICESADTLLEDYEIDLNTRPGDLVAILNCGAYGFSMANHYNSHPRCAEVLVNQDQFKVIREPETYSDLILREQI